MTELEYGQEVSYTENINKAGNSIKRIWAARQLRQKMNPI